MKIEGKQNKLYAPAKFHCEIKKKSNSVYGVNSDLERN